MSTAARNHETAESVPVKAKLFRGLGDKSRLALLEALREEPKHVSRLAAETGLSQPNTSMHLNCLWCCGLVERETRGRYTYYRVKSSRVMDILAAADTLLEEVADHITACERYENGE